MELDIGPLGMIVVALRRSIVQRKRRQPITKYQLQMIEKERALIEVLNEEVRRVLRDKYEF